MYKSPKVFGHALLSVGGQNLVNAKTPGPFPIIDVDHHFGVEILDQQNIGHWIMKGQYDIVDMNSIMPPLAQEVVDKIISGYDPQEDRAHIMQIPFTNYLQTFAEETTDILDRVKVARQMKDIQGERGNWNVDHYMHGMFNGMEVILATIEDRDPEFKVWATQEIDDKLDHILLSLSNEERIRMAEKLQSDSDREELAGRIANVMMIIKNLPHSIYHMKEIDDIRHTLKGVGK